MFKPIIRWERLTPETVSMLALHGKTIIQGTIDLDFGAGHIDDSSKCVWTTTGKRITVTYDYRTLVFAQSKETDPLYTERKSNVKTTNQGQ